MCAASVAGATTHKHATTKKKPARKVAAKRHISRSKSHATAVVKDDDTDPNNPPTWLHPADPKDTPAYRYGELTPDACKAELAKRKIDVSEEGATPGVLAPVRLQGAL